MTVAGGGLALSAALHAAALAGHIPELLQPFVGEQSFVPMAGLFAVWIPAVLIAQRLEGPSRMNFSWKRLLSGCPAWMRYAAFGLFVYAFVNFFIAIGMAPGSEHGTVRISSGHWMLFYGMAFCIFYSAWRQPRLLARFRCPAGHDVAPGDSYCPRCGLPISAADNSTA